MSAGRSHSCSYQMSIEGADRKVASMCEKRLLELSRPEAIVFSKLSTNETHSAPYLLQHPSFQIFPARLPRQFQAKESTKRIACHIETTSGEVQRWNLVVLSPATPCSRINDSSPRDDQSPSDYLQWRIGRRLI